MNAYVCENSTPEQIDLKCIFVTVSVSTLLLRWQSSGSPTQLIVFVKQAYLRKYDRNKAR